VQQRNRRDTDRLLVRYDVASRSVSVSFHSQIHVLPETFSTHDEGVIAGYSYARSQGWQGG
jgi:hypothetical protein